jgi:hypothetical protein
MKDKQKRKKERTWAEAARLVRRAARGASVGGVGGGFAAHPRRRGRGEALPTAGGGGATLALETSQPPEALGGGTGPPPGWDVAPFLHSPTPPRILAEGRTGRQLLPLGDGAPASPPPPFAGLGVAGSWVYSPRELGFREGSGAPPSLLGR